MLCIKCDEEAKYVYFGDSLCWQHKAEMENIVAKVRKQHEIDMEAIRWDKEKFQLQLEADKKKWENIKELFSPVFAMPEVKDALKKSCSNSKCVLYRKEGGCIAERCILSE